jgi:ribosome recycling factor
MEEHEIIEQTKKGMMGSIEHLKEDLRALRAGRANSAIIEGVLVEVYGSQMRVKELSTITTPETRQLLLTPFDVNNAGPIAKAIEKANLGVRVALEGKLVRIFFPELDQNRRKELADQVHKKKEECKVSVRSVRRESNEKLKKLKADGHIPEDDLKRLEKQVQELTDQYCKEVDELATAKEKEIMTV